MKERCVELRALVPPKQGRSRSDDLFRSVWPRAVLAATRIVGPGDDPEALAAEALTSAYDRWPAVQRHPAPEAWVLRVTINLALDRVRRRPLSASGDLIDLRDGAGGRGCVVDPFDEATAVRLALCAALRQLPSASATPSPSATWAAAWSRTSPRR